MQVQTKRTVSLYAIWISIINPYFRLIYTLSH